MQKVRTPHGVNAELTGNVAGQASEVRFPSGKRAYLPTSKLVQVLDEEPEVIQVSALDRLRELESDISLAGSTPELEQLRSELCAEAAKEVKVKWLGHD